MSGEGLRLSGPHKGCSRSVWLVGAYAIKVPRIGCWRWLLRGLLDNISEGQWKGVDAAFFAIAPVVWVCPGGFMLVTRRCEQPRNFKDKQLRRLDVAGRLANMPGGDLHGGNYGFLGRRLVKVDWA